MNTNENTLIGFAACLIGGSVLCYPSLGISGILSAVCAIYFGLVLVNGAGGAAKKRRNGRGNRR